jgi:hypothetical protein
MLLVSVVLGIVTATLALTRYCVVFPLQPSQLPRAPLDDELRASALRLEEHVRGVASRPHNLDYPDALEDAARYIETTLIGQGYQPQPQVYHVGGRAVRNIEVVIEPRHGRDSVVAGSGGTLVVGAHYDAPDDSPGANDNGSGVAALLELTRCLRTAQLERRMRLVFFVNEEQPYGKTPDMGSFRHAQALKETGEPVTGMFALETLGHFSDQPGSQRFPFPFGLLFPNRGNFVAFAGMIRGRSLVHRSVAQFRSVCAFPAIGAVAPNWIEGVDLSDHWAYDQFGFPACMITDTAPFRNPFYHSPADTPDTVDYASLARVVQGLEAMFRRMAG